MFYCWVRLLLSDYSWDQQANAPALLGNGTTGTKRPAVALCMNGRRRIVMTAAHSVTLVECGDSIGVMAQPVVSKARHRAAISAVGPNAKCRPAPGMSAPQGDGSHDAFRRSRATANGRNANLPTDQMVRHADALRSGHRKSRPARMLKVYRFDQTPSTTGLGFLTLALGESPLRGARSTVPKEVFMSGDEHKRLDVLQPSGAAVAGLC